MVTVSAPSAHATNPPPVFPAYFANVSGWFDVPTGATRSNDFIMNYPSQGREMIDVSGSDFVPAGPSQVPAILFSTNSISLDFFFGNYVQDPMIYIVDLQPQSSGGSATWDLRSWGGNCMWTITSGLTGASITHNGINFVLTPSQNSTQSGVLTCQGQASAIGLFAPNGSNPSNGYRSMTIALPYSQFAVETATSTTSSMRTGDEALTPTFTG